MFFTPAAELSRQIIQSMRYLLVSLCLLCISGIFHFANSQPAPSSPLQEAFDGFRDDETLRNASWGFYVVDITANQTILAHNIHQLLVPASTQKIITTATALMMLGPGYRYETYLEHDGVIDEDGVLHGSLYIRGSGDPALGSSRMDDTLALGNVFTIWEKALHDTGITKIGGHIIADARIFDHEMVPRHWIWEDIGNYFGAGASGLTVMENEYTVYFDAGDALGKPATVVATDPVIPAMSFVNEVTTGPAGSGDQVYIFGAPYITERRFTGTVPLGAKSFPVRGSMPDPPKYLAERFRVFLANRGIETEGQSTTYRTATFEGIIPSEDRKAISVWRSPLLADIIYRTNIASVNSYAENLLKTIGQHTTGEGTWESGLNAVHTFWHAYDADPPLNRIVDGSGLSPSNRLTAEQLMTVMIAAARHPTYHTFSNSLPLASYSGSLANHLRGTKSEGRLRAKSGFLNNVLAYAGYTTLQNENLAAFVIIVNNYDGSPASMRNKMIYLMDTITRHGERP